MGVICNCIPYEDMDPWRLMPGGTCDAPCSGDDTSICGGSTAFDLYQLVSSGAEERVQVVPAVAGDNAPVPAPIPAPDMDGYGTAGIAVYLGCFKLDEDQMDILYEDHGGGKPDMKPRVRICKGSGVTASSNTCVLALFAAFVGGTLSRTCITIITG